MFTKEEPDWILTKPVVEQVWSRCLQTFEGHSDSVRSVAFSPNGSRITSGSDDRTICIWDAGSGKEVHSVKMRHTPNGLRFEDLGDSGLHDSCGTVGGTSYMIQPNSQMTSNEQTPSNGIRPRWDLSGDGSWITWRGRGSIWLPPDFRPGESDVSRDGSAIAIGRPTGRVVILRMSMDVSFP
ncbi:hypothetical protein B0H67DRAFT_536136 [Lasiosphaeris hirsuta]|uniref:Mitochondrial division protein 1 n=1 Tax=Lasiosphaeris hirsuta TaxID=260670 RepID=A0AA40E3E8_9PEZI|nr:hypothetical protein B0H67DRAFT_536136 [Lasiosphaeris hirsuta]